MYNERDLAMEKISMEMGIPEKPSPSYPSQKKMECIPHQSEPKIYPRIIRTDQGLAVDKPPRSCNRSE